MNLLKKFRKTDATTILVELIRNTENSYLVVSSETIKKSLIDNDASLSDKILTLDDLKPEHYTKKPKLAKAIKIFYSVDVVEYLAQQNDKNAQNAQPLTVVKIKNTDGSHPSFKDLETWRSVFDQAQTDKDYQLMLHEPIEISQLTINSEGSINLKTTIQDGYQPLQCKEQINIKLTEPDIKDMQSINQDFYEGELSNSMLGRIILRKGIKFYKKLKENF